MVLDQHENYIKSIPWMISALQKLYADQRTTPQTWYFYLYNSFNLTKNSLEIPSLTYVLFPIFHVKNPDNIFVTMLEMEST